MEGLSTKGRYAARIMLRLALQRDGAPLQVGKIAKMEQIAPLYIEQILIKLKQAQLVRSVRGAKGGYFLARNPGEITVANILEAAEGSVALVRCVEDTCVRATGCATNRVWKEATEAMYKVFASITLDRLAKDAEALAAENAPASYEI